MKFLSKRFFYNEYRFKRAYYYKYSSVRRLLFHYLCLPIFNQKLLSIKYPSLYQPACEKYAIQYFFSGLGGCICRIYFGVFYWGFRGFNPIISFVTAYAQEKKNSAV